MGAIVLDVNGATLTAYFPPRGPAPSAGMRVQDLGGEQYWLRSAGAMSIGSWDEAGQPCLLVGGVPANQLLALMLTADAQSEHGSSRS